MIPARVTNRIALVPSRIGVLFATTSGQGPKLYKGAGVDFAFAFFDELGALMDISNIADLTLHVKTAGTPSGAPLILSTIGSEAINRTLTAAEWNAGTACHALFSILGSATGIAAATYDMTISGHTLDAPGDPDVWGVAQVQVIDAGISNLTSPPVGDQPAVTLDQLTAMLSNFARYGRNPAGKTITLVSPAGTFGATHGANDDGSPQLDLETL